MKWIALILLIWSGGLLKAQDGSNMYYIDIDNIDSTQVGKFVHLDFGEKSFLNNQRDTVSLAFKGYKRFREVRADNGYNNWFYEQYLESLETRNGSKLRIQKMKLLEVSEYELTLKLFGHLFDGEREIFSEFLTEVLTISKEDISQVLVHSKPPIRDGLSIYRVYLDDKTRKLKQSALCQDCFEPNEDNLFSHSFIDDWEIERLDFENQQIIPGPGGKARLKRLEVPSEGMAMALTLDGEVIYGFWLRNPLSSLDCDWVNATFISNLQFRHGLPDSYGAGSDPRFDPRLKEYSQRKK